MQNPKYEQYLKHKQEAFEAICSRCGKCCGADNDPCVNLELTAIGIYRCRCYAQRLGKQLTQGGNIFTCVPIREHIRQGSLPENCSYRSKR